MTNRARVGDRLAFASSFRFVACHALIVVPLCAVIALGRFVQVGHPVFNHGIASIVLEIVVEAGRVAMAVLVFGCGSLRAGVGAIRRFFRLDEDERKARFAGMRKYFDASWRSLTADFGLYLATVVSANLAIDAWAHGSWMTHLMAEPGASPAGDALVVLLKNLSVIPFTIVFQIHLAARLWLRPEERSAWLKRNRTGRARS